MIEILPGLYFPDNRFGYFVQVLNPHKNTVIKAGSGFLEISDNLDLLVEQGQGVDQAEIFIDITADIDFSFPERWRRFAEPGGDDEIGFRVKGNNLSFDNTAAT